MCQSTLRAFILPNYSNTECTLLGNVHSSSKNT